MRDEGRPADLRRHTNEMMWESLQPARRDPVPFFCECPDPTCYRSVWLRPEEYARARQEPGWAPIADHGALAGDG